MSTELLSDGDPTPLTEPYKTFKLNLIALFSFVGDYKDMLAQHRQDSKNFLQEVDKGRVVAADSKTGLLKLAEEHQVKINIFKQLGHSITRSDNRAEFNKQIRQLEQLGDSIVNDINDIEASTQEWDSKCRVTELSFSIIDSQNSSLLPMAFVYLVTLWDAFIADTIVYILKVHPQLISESMTNIQLNKSDIWKMANIQEIRAHLINAEVRKVTDDRKKLIDTFRDYWGIDLNKSLLNLDELSEIRARRDIWVHNAGVVNEQYKVMVSDDTLNKGQVAEITDEYFQKSLTTLLLFASFIHEEAFLKHYSKGKQG